MLLRRALRSTVATWVDVSLLTDQKQLECDSISKDLFSCVYGTVNPTHNYLVPINY